jgi:thiamine biosynthesis lipoprotein
MGTACEVIVVGGAPGLAERGHARVDELERRWSRFLDDSEISRLNRAGGAPVAVSHDTFLLVDRAVTAWRWTNGRFDPTVLRSVVDSGYDRSFELVSADGPAVPSARPAPGCRDFVLDSLLRVIRLPKGVGLDPGGLGKGLAADLVVEMLLDVGADGACVSLGGDLSVAGEPPDERGWRVGIADPYSEGNVVALVELTDHGMATSTRLTRRWVRAGRQLHHLVDPATGEPTDTGVDAVTLIAGQAWWAEAQTKAAFVAGADAWRALEAFGTAGVLFHGSENARTIGPLNRFLVAESSARAK